MFLRALTARVQARNETTFLPFSKAAADACRSEIAAISANRSDEHSRATALGQRFATEGDTRDRGEVGPRRSGEEQSE